MVYGYVTNYACICKHRGRRSIKPTQEWKSICRHRITKIDRCTRSKKRKGWELTIGHGEQGNGSLLVSIQSSLRQSLLLSASTYAVWFVPGYIGSMHIKWTPLASVNSPKPIVDSHQLLVGNYSHWRFAIVFVNWLFDLFQQRGDSRCCCVLLFSLQRRR
jgi:hypothetical protein